MQQEITFALFMVFFVLGVGALVVVFVTAARASNRKAPEESGLTPIFTDRCGGRVGYIAYTGPFVRVAIYESFLVVAARKPIVLRRVDIERIAFERERRSGVLGKTVNIHHRSDAVRSPICLNSSSRAQLVERLTAFTR